MGWIPGKESDREFLRSLGVMGEMSLCIDLTCKRCCATFNSACPSCQALKQALRSSDVETRDQFVVNLTNENCCFENCIIVNWQTFENLVKQYPAFDSSTFTILDAWGKQLPGYQQIFRDLSTTSRARVMSSPHQGQDMKTGWWWRVLRRINPWKKQIHL